jgi:hypothetical protein
MSMTPQPQPESIRVHQFYKIASRATGIAAAICLAVSYTTLPADDFKNSPEFTEKEQSLRQHYMAACENDAVARKQSVSECAREQAHEAAVNSQFSVTNRVAFLLFIMLGFQAAGLRVGQFMAQQRINDARKPKP